MPTLILTRKELDPGTFLGLSTLAIVSVIIAVSVGVMSSHRNHLAFQSGAANLVAGESHLPMVASKTVLPNVPGPELMQFPLAGNGLLQFTSGGHVLGFREKEVFIAAGDHALKVEFVGARASLPHVQGKPEMMVSNERGGRPLGKVIYPDVWDGVTVVYEGSPGAVAKSTYYIAPRTQQTGHTGSPVDQIRLRYNVPVRLDDKGNLVMSFETGEIRESAPVAWQEVGGQRVPVEVAYCLLGEKEVGFRVENHDPAVPLVIDPKLTWNTFLGSGNADYAQGIAVDGQGNVYVAGYSAATWGSGLSPFTVGGNNAFVAKLDPSGKRNWNTFMGSGNDDRAYGITADAAGNTYVTGSSLANWGDAPINNHNPDANADAFAVKLDPGGARVWNTFMGAAGASDEGRGIAVDGSGNVYVAGLSAADWAISGVSLYTGGNDAFVIQLNSTGFRQWHTFMGSAAGDDRAFGVGLDGSGNAYIVGYSNRAWADPAVNPHSGGVNLDAFVAKVMSGGTRFWHTFMGSSSNDYGQGIAVTNSGTIYVTGESDAGWGDPVNAHAGGHEVFAARLSGSGVLLWNTFMGCAVGDNGWGIAIAGGEDSYVVGQSAETWGAPVNAHAGDQDTFVARLSGSGVRLWNTFMGSSVADVGYGIAVDNVGNVYAAGYSDAAWGAPVNSYAGSPDAFVAKISPVVKPKMFYFSPVHNLKE